jgi:hypothetical protein
MSLGSLMEQQEPVAGSQVLVAFWRSEWRLTMPLYDCRGEVVGRGVS